MNEQRTVDYLGLELVGMQSRMLKNSDGVVWYEEYSVAAFFCRERYLRLISLQSFRPGRFS